MPFIEIPRDSTRNGRGDRLGNVNDGGVFGINNRRHSNVEVNVD